MYNSGNSGNSCNPDDSLHFLELSPNIPTSPTTVSSVTHNQLTVPIIPKNKIIPKSIITSPLVPQSITNQIIPQNTPLVTDPMLLQTQHITSQMVLQIGLQQKIPMTSTGCSSVINPAGRIKETERSVDPLTEVSRCKPIGNEISGQREWLNLKGKVFEELPIQWYNLRTSRFVSNKPGTYSPVYGLRGIRILGTIEDLNSFWRLNSEKIKQKFLNVTTIEDIIFEPFEDIVFLSEDAAERTQVCFIGTAGTVIEATTTTDVASLTEKQMESMCKFTFGGLFVKGKIDNVIDGDTFDMVFYVPIALLGQGRALGDKKLQAPIIPIQGYHHTGFFAKVSIRMYGYDAAEKDTEPGKLAKRLMEEKLKSLGGIVWCLFIGAAIADDKYGRTLAVLYEDEQKQRLLNNYLLEQEKLYNVKMVFPYLGGTKKQF